MIGAASSMMLLWALAAVGPEAAPPRETRPPALLQPGEDGTFRLLFVGNSLTYSHEMPRMLERLLKQSRVPLERLEVQALPNYGLEDHWNRSQTRRLLAEGDWDVVFLQQGPSATEGRPSLLQFTRRFAEESRRNASGAGVYMVWPSRRRAGDYPAVLANHRRAAAEAGAYLFPVGHAWSRYRDHGDGPDLYGRDGFHPSRVGAYLAALTIWRCFSEMPLAEVDHAQALGRRKRLKPDVAAALGRAVDEAHEAYPRRCRP